MPQTAQAKKYLRKSKKRSEHNLKIKQDIKTLLKKIRQAIDAKEAKDKVEEMLKQAQKSIDKAVQKGVLKRNTGARKLSRLMSFFKKGGNVSVKKTDEKEVATEKAPETEKTE